MSFGPSTPLAPRVVKVKLKSKDEKNMVGYQCLSDGSKFDLQKNIEDGKNKQIGR